MVYETELMHYGRKGMKWYQHIFGSVSKGKTKTGNATDTPRTEEEIRAERQKQLQLGKIPSEEMTDEEIRQMTERLRLEKTYNNELAEKSKKDNSAISDEELQAKRQKQLQTRKTPLSQMTDEEVQQMIDRLKLEKSYNDLLKESRTAKFESDKAGKFLDKVVNTSIDKIAENVIADVLAQALKAGAVGAVNKYVFKDEVVFTNNKKKG